MNVKCPLDIDMKISTLDQAFYLQYVYITPNDVKTINLSGNIQCRVELHAAIESSVCL